jgi:four helix bundle protein
MAGGGVRDFGAYQRAVVLFDLVVEDTALIQKDPRCYRLVSQQVGSADSICANIEEGYGRVSRAEYARFLDFARGSARETQGRYQRMKHWLPPEIVRDRAQRLDEIIGILTTTITRLRSSYEVRDGDAQYEESDVSSDEGRDAGCPRPSTLDPRPSTLDPRPSEQHTVR